MALRDPQEWHGPTLAVQMRAAGRRDAEMADAFRRFVRESGGIIEEVANREPVAETCTSHTYERLSFAGYEQLPVRVTTWLRSEDSVLYLNIPLSALKRYGSVVPDALIEGFVGVCRAVHTSVQLQVAVIGEEARVAAAVLDLWEMGQGPKHGSAGTLWPEADGELKWFPDAPLSLAGV